jgi:hypothetical protein
MASKSPQSEKDISPLQMDQGLSDDDVPQSEAPSSDAAVSGQPDSEGPTPVTLVPADVDNGTISAPTPANPVPGHAGLGRSVRGGNMEMRVFSRAMQDLDVLTGGTRAATYDEVDEYVERAIRIERDWRMRRLPPKRIRKINRPWLQQEFSSRCRPAT